MKINKYLSFDISLHKTLYYINKHYSNTSLSYKSLIDILNDNWLSTGYQSNYEESLFKSFATTAMKKYSLNPLDRGCDIVLINKFITAKEGSKLKYAKIDKLHFLSNDQLELIDYKSGKHLPPINKSFFTSKTLFTITSIKKKFGVYPDIFSLYYLRHGIKFSQEIPQIYTTI
ncbi:hypothetical protein OW763_00365 [Clostridium aestuarii]|uniref:PD-(D/E)XK endonuclease-like domain-containing protein n=1 Tax=Clostridium aestuarii TaxID=338193 RepID=A0ABT4CV19_9CLOT|nr:hypothetical protein [Clostridium aestuarii]MCY6482811.1 hypothetical protein [Clostridium aestuarii]